VADQCHNFSCRKFETYIAENLVPLYQKTYIFGDKSFSRSRRIVRRGEHSHVTSFNRVIARY
jgi:hypothetical protein